MVGGDSLDRPWEGFFEGDLDFTLLIKVNHSRSKRRILAKSSIFKLTSLTSLII
jgi:hypothetical protein